MASIIEGFLVRLGFDIDQDGMLKFNANIGNAAKRVAAVGKAAAATGIALGAAFAKSAHDVDRLYKVSNNTGASIKGFKAISRAVANVGGNAENVQAAFVALSDNIKTYGASFESLLKNNLGVSLYDARGRMRDMADVFVDLRNKLAAMAKTNPGFARQTAELIGLGGAFDDLMKKGFTEELMRQRQAAAAWGDSLDANAKRANTFTTSLSRLWDTIATGAQTASLDFLEVSGLDTWVSNLAKQAETELPALAKTFKKGLQSLFDGSWWDSLIEGTEAIFSRRGAETEVDNPELEALLDKYAEKKQGSRTFTEQVVDTHAASRAQAQAAYANPNSVPKWRPGSAANDSTNRAKASAASEGSAALQTEIIADTSTVHYIDTAAHRQAIGSESVVSQPASPSITKGNSSSSVTVNQNITVNGVQDGRKFAQDLARTTDETVSRNVGANAF